MQVTLYGLGSCDTCRKARREITAAGHDLTWIDVRADGVPTDLLAAWVDRGLPLLNRRSKTWAGLSQAERDRADTPATLVALLVDHPTLIKRPVIEAAGETFVGWTKDVAARFT